MKKTKYILITLLFLLSLTVVSYAQTGWVQQNSGTLSNLNCVFFVDTATGYAVGDSAIMKTTSGGSNWIRQSSGHLTSVFFLDVNTGYICGGSSVAKTTNGGFSWNLAFSYNQASFNTLYFINYSTGMVGGYIWNGENGSDCIFRTTDGGVSWNLVFTYPTSTIFTIYFPNGLTGYAGGFSPFFKTTNAGQSWNQIGTSGYTTLQSIYFINSMTGWAAGNNVYKTTDGGNNWNSYTAGNSLNAVRFVNDQTGWVCGSGGSIYESTNGGINWTLQSSGTTTYLYSMSFVNDQTGWALGASGRILKTTNGGITFIQPISNEIPNEFNLYQNYPNPFNPSTSIEFQIPANSNTHETQLRIYDTNGKLISVLINKHLNPGKYSINWDASAFPSGIYFYELNSGNFNSSRKMTLLK